MDVNSTPPATSTSTDTSTAPAGAATPAVTDPAGGGATPEATKESTPATPQTPDSTPPAPTDPKAPESGADNSDTEGNPLAKGPEEQKPAEEEKPKEVSDEDYLKKFSPAEGEDYKMPTDDLKEMLPAFREAGLSPDQANGLANAFLKYEKKMTNDYLSERHERIEKWKPVIRDMKVENPKCIEQAQAAIDHFCSTDDPALARIIRETELGSSPAMLKILAAAGRTLAADGGAGTNTASAPRAMSFSEIMMSK